MCVLFEEGPAAPHSCPQVDPKNQSTELTSPLGLAETVYFGKKESEFNRFTYVLFPPKNVRVLANPIYIPFNPNVQF